MIFLFSEDEIKKLNYLRKIAVALNIVNDSFISNKLLNYLSDYYTVRTHITFSMLKDFIVNIDKIFIPNLDFYSNLLNQFKDFEYTTRNNINTIHNYSYDLEQTIKIFKSFFLNLIILLDYIKNKEFPNHFDATLLNEILNSEYFNLLYRNVKSIISEIDERPLPNINLLENHIDPVSINNSLIVLEDKFNNLSNLFTILKNDYYNNKVENFNQQKIAFEDKANETLLSFKNSMNDLQNNYQKELKPKISDLKNNLENSRIELEALLGDVELYQDKMTNKAVAEMSAHYYEKSKFERNSYFFLTLISALIIIFSVKSAYNGVNNYYDQYVNTDICDSRSENKDIIPPLKLRSYEECMKDLAVKREATQKYAFNYLVFRLSFSLLLFLAVIYASRIAMRAYNHWRQSENMYLKLNTLSPFIGSLEKPVRNDVHLSLVPDYFGKDAGIVENSKDATKDIPNNISNVAIKLIEQAGSTIGSKLGSDKESKNSDSESSTEKNTKKSDDETK